MIHNTQFIAEYGCQFRNDPIRELASKAWKEYDDRCESFDRIVCRCRNERGVAIPSNGRELGSINRNSKKVAAEIEEQYGIAWRDIKRFGDASRRS